jgi:hypothetical protein
MAKKPTAKKKPARHVAGHDAEREAIQAGLRRAVNREATIQKLTRQLRRNVSTNDAQALVLVNDLAARNSLVVLAESEHAMLLTKAVAYDTGQRDKQAPRNLERETPEVRS